MYLSLSVDPTAGQLVFIVSKQGGSDIENIAARQPDAVLAYPISLTPQASDFIPICAALDLPEHHHAELTASLASMHQLFVERDMSLMEINPLVLDIQDKLIALDATVVFDDNALFRQGHEEQMDAYTHLPDMEFKAAVLGLNYVQLDGNIATLSAGAGLAMATVDAIIENGRERCQLSGHPAVYRGITVCVMHWSCCCPIQRQSAC